MRPEQWRGCLGCRVRPNKRPLSLCLHPTQLANMGQRGHVLKVNHTLTRLHFVFLLSLLDHHFTLTLKR